MLFKLMHESPVQAVRLVFHIEKALKLMAETDVRITIVPNFKTCRDKHNFWIPQIRSDHFHVSDNPVAYHGKNANREQDLSIIQLQKLVCTRNKSYLSRSKTGA